MTPSEGSAEPRDKLILIVDDDPEILDLVSLLARASGFKVLTALNGEKAVALLDHKPDAIVLDILMPGSNGLAVLAALRERGSAGPPVMVISAFVDSHPSVQQAAIDPRVALCLAKPIDPEALVGALHRLTGAKPIKGRSSHRPG